jgi:hypothetical protein
VVKADRVCIPSPQINFTLETAAETFEKTFFSMYDKALQSTDKEESKVSTEREKLICSQQSSYFPSPFISVFRRFYVGRASVLRLVCATWNQLPS